MKWLRNWFAKNNQSQRAPRRYVIPRLEQLESREVMTVTYHPGGALLTNVETQGLFYGPTWTAQQRTNLDNFLQNLVGTNSPYINMLSQFSVSGQTIGSGSNSTGDFYNNPLSTTLNDSTIQSTIQSEISANHLQAPDANRLYVVYVQPNVEVINDHQASTLHSGFANSAQDFAGYHSAFTLNGTAIHYAVIPTPYGVISTPQGNISNGSSNLSLGAFGETTTVASHEVAESVTDPNFNAWFEDSTGKENADIYNGRNVTLNGYQVQEVAAPNNPQDPALIPTGSLVGPFVVAEIPNSGDPGIWRYSTSGGWLKISTATTASHVAVDAAGDVVAEIPGAGIWRYEDIQPGDHWKQLSTSDATTTGSSVDISGDGSVVAEIPGGGGPGIWRYEDAVAGGWQDLSSGTATATQVAIDPIGDVAAQLTTQDANTLGVWGYQNATQSWQHLENIANATSLAIALGGVSSNANGSLFGGLVVAALPGHGVDLLSNTLNSVNQITSNDASLVGFTFNRVTNQFEVVAENSSGPQGAGIYTYSYNSTLNQWQSSFRSTTADATDLSIASDGSVFAAIPDAGAAQGIWHFDPITGIWTQITTSKASSMGAGG